MAAMKRVNSIGVRTVVMFSLMVVCGWWWLVGVEGSADGVEESGIAEGVVGGVEEDYELGKAMAWLQRWTAKLWYAGRAGNWELAGFYLHETEEVVEEMEKAGVVEDDHQVSELIRLMLGPALEGVEKAVGEGDVEQFGVAYRAMIASCNACHVATDHGFLEMVVPEGDAPWAQKFAP